MTRNGEPTGVFKDNALDIVDHAVPEPALELSMRALDTAMSYVAERGVTSVHHMGTWHDVAVFRRAHDMGALRTRISAAVPLSTWEKLRDTVAAQGRGDLWLHIGGLKGFVDGSLGSHTAAMLAPFSDAPSDRGLFVTPPEKLYEWTSGADKAGLQVMVHAIGDSAIRTQLNIYERVERENGAKDRRFRIEHAQHIAPSDLPRFAKLGVIASMQPYHAIDDGRWAEHVIGAERAKTTYAFRSLLASGATLAFGSDWFVAPPTPLVGIYAAVTRRTLDDAHPDGWVPEQKITVEQALRAYTHGGAVAGFREKGWECSRRECLPISCCSIATSRAFRRKPFVTHACCSRWLVAAWYTTATRLHREGTVARPPGHGRSVRQPRRVPLLTRPQIRRPHAAQSRNSKPRLARLHTPTAAIRPISVALHRLAPRRAGGRAATSRTARPQRIQMRWRSS